MYVSASRLSGDGVEARAFGICEEILASRDRVPFEVYRWAFLHRILLHSVCSREDLAIQVARDWAQRYPDDAALIKVKCVVLQIVATRGSEHFTPTLADLRFAESGLFDNPAPDHQNPDILDAYRTDAAALERLYNLTDDIELLHESLDRLNQAEVLHRTALAQDHAADARISREYLQANLAQLQRSRSELEALIAARSEDR
jgi:hypothetical protein